MRNSVSVKSEAHKRAKCNMIIKLSACPQQQQRHHTHTHLQTHTYTSTHTKHCVSYAVSDPHWTNRKCHNNDIPSCHLATPSAPPSPLPCSASLSLTPTPGPALCADHLKQFLLILLCILRCSRYLLKCLCPI